MGENKIYHTQQVWIKLGHRMYNYFQEMCENSKNLYNTTNFFIRQVFTGLTTTKALQPLQAEVLDTIENNINKMNINQVAAYEKRLANEPKKPKEKQTTLKCNLFEMPDVDNPYVSYNLLDALFKQIKQPDYVNGSANIMHKYLTKKGITLQIKDVTTDHPMSYKIA